MAGDSSEDPESPRGRRPHSKGLLPEEGSRRPVKSTLVSRLPFPACHAAVTFAMLSMCGCTSGNRQAVSTEQIPELAAEIDKIPAVDHHAHPVAVVPEGTQDREFDALPVDNMEPASDPLPLRAGNPRVTDAWRALFS